jgi:hypothetical protein
LTKDVVEVPASRVVDDKVFGLDEALRSTRLRSARKDQKSRQDHFPFKKGRQPVEPQDGNSNPAVKAKGLILEKYNDINYGYLRVHVDKEQLRIGFHQVGALFFSR